MPEDVAFELVQLVIKNGKISNDGKQYCYATTFESGYVVYTDLTKTGTHVFNIYQIRSEKPSPSGGGWIAL